MPARSNKIFCIYLLFLLGAGGPAWSGENDRVLVLGDAPHYDLAPYLEVLDGDGGALTIDQVDYKMPGMDGLEFIDKLKHH